MHRLPKISLTALPYILNVPSTRTRRVLSRFFFNKEPVARNFFIGRYVVHFEGSETPGNQHLNLLLSLWDFLLTLYSTIKPLCVTLVCISYARTATNYVTINTFYICCTHLLKLTCSEYMCISHHKTLRSSTRCYRTAANETYTAR